jgi:hypothetical protein
MHPISDTITQRQFYSATHSTKFFYASKVSRSNPEVSPVRHQRRRYELDNLQGEIRKLMPPTFNGEKKMEMMLKLGFLE